MKPFISPLPAVTGMVSTVGPTTTFRSLLTAITATTGRRWLTVDSSVRSTAMDALDDVSPDEYRKIFQALYEYESPDLSHVEVPTLVLYGDHEAPLVKRQGERLATTVGRGSSREISNAGHLVNQDAPDSFNEACRQFFGTLDPTVVERPLT
ncbi:hypothetical protein VB773_09755 [Haloarculaceae archaeon H-GB2-1]|nr:hypothetical protein [Haloarculaceae archaeon H-GB2-1]